MAHKTSAAAAKKAKRNYSDRTLKLLWGRAAGRCAVPSCRIFVYAEETEHDPAVPIGDIAHMAGASDRGPRAQPSMPARERHDYDNLILLCKTCHAKIDGQKNTYAMDYIRDLKETHEKWVEASLPERGKTRIGWATILLEDYFPIDSETFERALEPDYILGDVFRVKALGSWPELLTRTRRAVCDAFEAAHFAHTRFAIFPLARVSTCIMFGHHLTNRPTTRLFQYHRDEHSWTWPLSVKNEELVRVDFSGEQRASQNVAFLFDLSVRIDAERILALLGSNCSIIRLSVPNPSTAWLQSEAQLLQLGVLTRSAFERTLQSHGAAERWHIFYAGPAPGAVLVGQQLNPTMTPTVQLYEYAHPDHVQSVLITPGALP